MVTKFERDLTTVIASTVHITKFNDGDKLPFQLVCHENDRIVWTCGYDEFGKITSVFSFKGDAKEEGDKKMQYLESEKEANHIRDELLKNKWVLSKNPDTTISYPGMEPITVGDVKLNRRQKRNFPKLMNAISNPKDRKNKEKLKERISKET